MVYIRYTRRVTKTCVFITRLNLIAVLVFDVYFQDVCLGARVILEPCPKPWSSNTSLS